MRHSKVLFVAVAPLLSIFSATKVGASDFSSASYPVGGFPQCIAAGDFNGDGHPDLAIGNRDTRDISMLLNNGDGTLKATNTIALAVIPHAIASGDFNGDGKDDLIVLDPAGGPALLFFSKGDGTFQSPVPLPATSQPLSVVVADFNEDKKLDLLIGDNTIHGVQMFLGNGDGTFQLPTTAFPTSAGPTGALVPGDFNGDGHIDVIVANGQIGELPASGDVFFLPGAGNGTFGTAKHIAAFTTVNEVRQLFFAGDFNGDGKLDLVLRTQNRQVATCQAGRTPPCYKNTEAVTLFDGNGDGAFAPGVALEFLGFDDLPTSWAPADFNHDGKLDLFTDFALRLGRGDGTFLQSSALGKGTLNIAVDLNHDGLPDVASVDSRNAQVEIFLNSSPTTGADLAITFDGATPGILPVGGASDFYQVRVENQGPQDATGVTLTESLPPGLQLVSVQPAQGSCSGSSSITCSFGAMTDASSTEVRFTVSAVSAGSFTDELHIASQVSDGNSKNDSLSFAVTAKIPPDLVVSGSASKSAAITGDVVTYTIEVANVGSTAAMNVLFVDSLSDRTLSVSSLSSSQGTCAAGYSRGAQEERIDCSIGTVNAGTKVSISFALTMGQSEVVTNSLSVSADVPDSNPGNNSAFVKVTVNGANLHVTQKPSDDPVVAGAAVTYSLTVKNSGPTDANNVVLSDTTPQGANVASVQASQGTCAAPSNGAISCSLGTLAASASATVSFAATPSSGGTMTNVVSVTSNSPDPDTSDNSSSLTVTVQDFSVTPSTTSLMLSRGGSVNETLTFGTQGGFTGNLNLSCSVSGPAPMPTCGISPASVAAGGSATLRVSAPALSSSLIPAAFGEGQAGAMCSFSIPLSMLGVALVVASRKQQRKNWWVLVLLLAVSILPAACGGSSASETPQQFTVSVTATAATSKAQHTTSITVTVR